MVSAEQLSRDEVVAFQHASFLFTAPVTGTFFCQIRAQTDAGNDLGFHMTVVAAPRPGGTWLEIDNFTDAAPLWWQINTCDSTGSDANCVYLGRPRGLEHPTTAILHGWPSTFLDTPFLHMSDLWVAPPNATTADVVGHMQITSCYFGTASCPEREQGAPENGPFDAAVFRVAAGHVIAQNSPRGPSSLPDHPWT